MLYQHQGVEEATWEREDTIDECKTHQCFEFISHDILSIFISMFM